MIKLKAILNLLLWGSTSLSNSYEFAQLIQDFHFRPEDTLVSFDVTSLHMRVPIMDTLQIVETRLTELWSQPVDILKEITTLSNKGIMKLLRHVLEQCFFSWDGVLFRQISGLPMGGRLSPILANLYIEQLEHQVLCSTLIVPHLYLR